MRAVNIVPILDSSVNRHVLTTLAQDDPSPTQKIMCATRLFGHGNIRGRLAVASMAKK